MWVQWLMLVWVQGFGLVEFSNKRTAEAAIAQRALILPGQMYCVRWSQTPNHNRWCRHPVHVSAARLEDRDVGLSVQQLLGVRSPTALGVPEARQPDIVKAKRVHLEPAHAAPVGSAEHQFAAAWRYGAALCAPSDG